MDRLLKREKLDLKLTPYKVLACSKSFGTHASSQSPFLLVPSVCVLGFSYEASETSVYGEWCPVGVCVCVCVCACVRACVCVYKL